jgi:hypothetical protein
MFIRVKDTLIDTKRIKYVKKVDGKRKGTSALRFTLEGDEWLWIDEETEDIMEIIFQEVLDKLNKV